MPVTLKDLAAIAGVTPTVVSHVLHQRASTVRVSAATAERIRDAAAQMGYRVNIQARNFRNSRTGMIAVCHGMGFARPIFGQESRYFGLLMDGIVDAAFGHGFAITLCPQLLGQNPADSMSDGRFDGLIWYDTTSSGENAAMIERCTVPLALVHRTSDDYSGRFPTVICDNQQGIELGLAHLFENGHRNIAFAVSNSHISPETAQRAELFLQSMRSRGFGDSATIVYVDEDADSIAEYLRSDNRVTAIFAHNEGLGGRILRAADSIGVSVPTALSVIAFDSTTYCDELLPRLTSVSQPLVTMGERAVDALIRQISEPEAAVTHLVLPCGLDIRDSVGQCNLNPAIQKRKS